MRLLTTGMALASAAALAAPAGIAAAEGPLLHTVTYTVYTDNPFTADIYYRDRQPPNFAEYSHDPYVFSPKAVAAIGPDRPWVLDVRLADPNMWAMVVGTSGLSPNPPNFHCTLAVDGNVVVTNSGLKGALCSLRTW